MISLPSTLRLLTALCLGSLTLFPASAKPKPPEIAHYETRPEVQAFMADISQRHGIALETLETWFRQAKHLPTVIKAIQPPKDPGIRSWQAYRGRFVEPRRITAGLKFWAQHRDTLAQAEARFGVPAEIMVAIIGVETIYGRHMGRYETFSALCNLAFDYPPRADLFRRELEALILLARDEGRSPLSYQGSYAGAMGLPQFLPSSQRQWAVDFDGDGKVDLSGSPQDAIGSVGRFLAEHGWQKDGPILATARLAGEAVTDRSSELLAEGILPKRLPTEMKAYGIQSPEAPEAPAALIDYVTPQADTEYRLGYRNFYVITRYNRSSFYATAVADLAQALRQQRQEILTP